MTKTGAWQLPCGPRSDANHVCRDPARVGNVFFVFSGSWKGSWRGAKEGGDRIPEPRGKGVERTVTPSGHTPSSAFLATSLPCPALGLLKPIPDYGHGLGKWVRARTVYLAGGGRRRLRCPPFLLGTMISQRPFRTSSYRMPCRSRPGITEPKSCH